MRDTPSICDTTRLSPHKPEKRIYLKFFNRICCQFFQSFLNKIVFQGGILNQNKNFGCFYAGIQKFSVF